MNHVFGPLLSRRLGRSLGVDPVPFKTCNWNCVYCQLGRTAPLAHERRDYFPPEEVVAQVRAALTALGPEAVDWVTFAGSGEPTLHASLGRMIRGVKSFTAVPVAVLTNGALLYRADVREDLLAADAVLPTLDAGSEEVYRRINRPWPDLSFSRLAAGLFLFRRAYKGKLWVEVMLVKGLNDSQEALREIADRLALIRPDEVHVNRPVRPPAEAWAEPPDEEALARARAVLGATARVVTATGGCLTVPPFGDAEEAVLGILTRHPMGKQELLRALGDRLPEDVQETLDRLVESGLARTVTRLGRRFWTGAGARYGESEVAVAAARPPATAG